MYCMQCFLKSKCIKSRTSNDKNRWIIKKVMVLKKLLPRLATRGIYSPVDWRCDEAWREQTLVYPPVMCQQRLTHWGRVTHICVGKLSIVGSDNGLSPGRHQAISLGTNVSKILIEIRTFSLKKLRLKMSSAKCCPFRLGLNVLSYCTWELNVMWFVQDEWKTHICRSIQLLLMP